MTLNQEPYQPSAEDLHKNGKHFLQTFYTKVGWIICTGMLSWKLNYIFSDMLIAIFEPVLIILSKIEYIPFFVAPSW